MRFNCFIFLFLAWGAYGLSRLEVVWVASGCVGWSMASVCL